MHQSGTIGIVGGGQLGRMLTEAAVKLGFKVVVVDPNDNCPAAQVGAEQIKADFYDAEAIKALAKKSDYITIESEHINTEVLDQLAALGKSVNPAPKTVALIQDKFDQKQFLHDAGVPVADFTKITDEESAQKIFNKFGGKMLLKTRRGAYDGRGNALVNSTEELRQALDNFKGQTLYAEKFVPFVKELAVMIARGANGEIATYPVTETVHERNICVETFTPAQVSPETAEKARQVALSIANHLKGTGVFGIEMFLTADGQVLVNEIAPRVHNSGHYTIEACKTSQFEQHIRAITGMPLGSTELIVPAAVMINILGYRQGPAEPMGIAEAEADGRTKVHIYGKAENRFDRKMGHLTSVGDTVEAARERAEAASEFISI